MVFISQELKKDAEDSRPVIFGLRQAKICLELILVEVESIEWWIAFTDLVRRWLKP